MNESLAIRYSFQSCMLYGIKESMDGNCTGDLFILYAYLYLLNNKVHFNLFQIIHASLEINKIINNFWWLNN